MTKHLKPWGANRKAHIAISHVRARSIYRKYLRCDPPHHKSAKRSFLLVPLSVIALSAFAICDHRKSHPSQIRPIAKAQSAVFYWCHFPPSHFLPLQFAHPSHFLPFRFAHPSQIAFTPLSAIALSAFVIRTFHIGSHLVCSFPYPSYALPLHFMCFLCIPSKV